MYCTFSFSKEKLYYVFVLSLFFIVFSCIMFLSIRIIVLLEYYLFLYCIILYYSFFQFVLSFYWNCIVFSFNSDYFDYLLIYITSTQYHIIFLFFFTRFFISEFKRSVTLFVLLLRCKIIIVYLLF